MSMFGKIIRVGRNAGLASARAVSKYDASGLPTVNSVESVMTNFATPGQSTRMAQAYISQGRDLPSGIKASTVLQEAERAGRAAESVKFAKAYSKERIKTSQKLVELAEVESEYRQEMGQIQSELAKVRTTDILKQSEQKLKEQVMFALARASEDFYV